MLCFNIYLYHPSISRRSQREKKKGVPNQEKTMIHMPEKTNYISVSNLKGAAGVSGGIPEWMEA